MPKKLQREAEYQEPFVPLAVLEHALRFWWVVALLIVLGGLVGYLAYTMRPPLYEATATFAVAIDFVGTGPLTQYDEDLAINTAGNLFIAEDLLQKVVDQASAEGMPLSMAELKAKINLERKFSIWTIRVRDANPQSAKQLAEIWMQQGQTLLLESFGHAVSAYRLDQYIQAQENCLVKAASNEPGYAACGTAKFADIQANLRDSGAELTKEKLASRGLFSGLTMGPFNPVEVTNEPVTAGRSQFLFLGGLLGFLISLVVLESGLLKLLPMKR